MTFAGDDHKDSFTSKLKFYNYEFQWRIENFAFLCKTMKKITSKKFKSNHSEGYYFIEFDLTELTEGDKDPFVIRFICADDIRQFINFKIEISNCLEKSKLKSLHTFNKTIRPEQLSIKVSELLSASENKELNTILLKCEFTVFVPNTNAMQTPLIAIEKCNGLMESNKKFLDNEEFKDVTFNVEDKKFTAHKIILASRSPVFAAMFKNKMKEELTSVAEINDIKPEIFQQMLNFIYTDRVENLEESAVELIDVAEKYQLENLKSMCINSLNDNLSLTTVSKTLGAAQLYSIELLKNKCFYFISERKYDILETKEFQELIKEHPKLSIDILKIEKKVNPVEEEEEEKIFFNNWGYSFK
ncbi:speckle-type POZ protein-like [Leptopilina heterotoma]|uniref:speckle-type POZ protein-like n=1 Tax=Leptopilina heterotoma TaxID=63436 RepID=UPI001CA8D5CF|nr:speckle-type POZ protein-like [Leptopilina heterotoma]